MRGWMSGGPVAAALLLVAGCELLDGGSAARETVPLTYLAAERHVGQEPGEPVLTLQLTSDEIFPCFNYRIDAVPVAVGGRVDVYVDGVDLGDVCLTALGPASATLPLAAEEGTTTLRIVNGRVIDEAEVTVTEDAVRIRPVRADASVPADTLAWRYPRRSFAAVCGTLVEDAGLCDAFDARLREALRLEEIPVPEAGRWPYPRQSSGHDDDAPTRVYRYDDEADFERAGDVLAAFTRDELAGRSGATVWLVNWRNEAFHSWLVNRE